MSRMLGISGVWPQGWTVKREYYHLDLLSLTPKTQERPTRAVLLLESVLSQKADSRLCRYNANFIYKSQKILPTHTIGDILNTMIADCQI